MIKADNPKEAKKVLRQLLSRMARDAAIAKNLTKKFWPQATVPQSNLDDIAGRAVDLRSMYERFPG